MPFDTAIPTFGKGGKGVFPQESYNSRKPIKSLQETQKSWVYRGARNPKENVFDKYSIYNHKNNPYKWDSHGNVSTATTQTNFEIGFREEKKYVRKAFGRTTPHVTGSAHPTQDRIYHYRPKTRQKSALTEQVNWYHQGIHDTGISKFMETYRLNFPEESVFLRINAGHRGFGFFQRPRH
ncbi:uncharacterized protein [Ptychodera flava]|uniref:uncharacterized protein isoform X2 n=1 Tax=Ptychodera flava TaxID=63121 RepID=UPI00396A41CE